MKLRVRVPALIAAGAASVILLAGCQSGTTPPGAGQASEGAASDSTIGDGHGAIAGATEIAEPALHLTSVDTDGAVHHLDLLDEQSEQLGSIDPADTLDTEGRFLFAGRSGGVSIVDSGVWTWNHVDHFHYYEAPARIVGELTGEGTPIIVTSDLGAGVSFDGGEAVLLDFEALKRGEIVESFRLAVDPGAGLVVPVPGGALVADPAAAELRHLDADGDEIDRVACTEPSGSIATNVGVVVGCAEGAVLAVSTADGTTFESVPYPADAGPRAASFSAREGRPTVAGRTGTSAFWLLDTRERTWTSFDLGEPIVAVTAVDDADENVVVLAADGSVLTVSGADGTVLARSAPLVAASLADPALAAGVNLIADQHRTYLNGPAEKTMFEIDPADGARVARTFATAHTPAFVAETGR